MVGGNGGKSGSGGPFKFSLSPFPLPERELLVVVVPLFFGWDAGEGGVVVARFSGGGPPSGDWDRDRDRLLGTFSLGFVTVDSLSS